MLLISVIAIIAVIAIAAVAGAVIYASYQNGGGRPSRREASSGSHLQVSIAGGPPQVVPLTQRGSVLIGRERTSAVMIDNHLVSRHHARIIAADGGWVIEDTDSANGTFLNGRPVVCARLNSGDLIEVGPARMTVNCPAPARGGSASARSSVAQPGPSTNGGSASTSRQIFGHYAIVRSLGEGGFGKIMLAQDQRDRRLVAIKVLTTSDDYLLTKFRQEGAIKLDHQHIAHIYDTGQVDGRPYIAMEYVDGVNLRKLLDERPMTLETALIIIGQVLIALEYAHRNQIIHRDIKPENVMISAQHGVKIIDFGIAKVLSTVTRTRDGMMIGTPQYMSYEQAMGQTVTPASDIYTTAIVLYEMLTANVPFSSDNAVEIVQMHQTARPLPPARINPAIPASVEAAILKALEKEQSARFRSAIEFSTALGCPLGKSLPQDVIADVSRLTPPIANERSNAVDLPTRAPAVPQVPSVGRAVLRVESGPRRGQIITLAAIQVIGRMEIDPSDGTISRQHFRMEQQQGAYVICDSSTYGTVVNGVRLQTGVPLRIQPGAQIQVGQTVLIYENHS